ncbi:MAG: filamentous hemagglutinin N-terminal domain-containing protein, partial [Coleofasciculus sp. S288]|nr:filamentous hemagglutinin N-terminal domain-containing protein [Coleofasciculus sp. S288]
MKAFHRNGVLIGSGVLSCLLIKFPSQAQIVPDGTLLTNVNQSGNVFEITGGQQAGSNVFYSFREFSLPTGQEAFFNNALTIENIISRVTGSSISNIDGLIRANGIANLFLINPNGIIFGSNASLNIGGSFLSSTANSINFADGTQFSATNPQAQPLLTVSVPIGLGFGGNPGVIRVQGTGHSITVADPFYSPINRGDNLTGLRVQPGKTLALVGGDITLEGGILTAQGGRIELGSIDSGLVSLSLTTQDWTLGYEGVQSFQNIQLSQQALADASGAGSGSIQVQGNRVTLTDGSVILIQNQGVEPAGSITVNAAKSLELSGANLNATVASSLSANTLGDGKGGDIAVSTERLVLQDGATILARTFSAGRGGNITVNASKSVQVLGFSPINILLSSNLSTMTFGSGTAGNLTLSTGQLTLLKGTNVGSLTVGIGLGGNVNVNATESVEVSEFNPISISSQLGTATISAGQAGNLEINTNKLVLRAGGRINASTFGSGNSGNISVNATESVEVSGTVPGTTNSSLIIASANLLDELNRMLFGLPPMPSGDSGNVTINTPLLSVTDGAQVTVRNDGTGKAGMLRVNAGSIFLDDGGGITASTSSGQGGNIELQLRDVLLMRRESSISASADGIGNGGNIDINTPLLVTVSNENSDISANSRDARGGNVTINTSGIFGIQFRDRNTPLSDITATGKNSSLNGTVDINVRDVDPSSGLVQLPATPVDPTQAIAQGCPADKGNSLIITGRGGLPPLPSEALRTN